LPDSVAIASLMWGLELHLTGVNAPHSGNRHITGHPGHDDVAGCPLPNGQPPPNPIARRRPHAEVAMTCGFEGEVATMCGFGAQNCT